MENIENSAAATVEMKRICELQKDLDPVLAKEIERAIVRADQIKFEQSVGKPELVAALKLWRRQKAKELEVPVYIVLTNMVLLQIAKDTPATMEELLSIEGFGPMKAGRYGEEILQVVARECEVVSEQQF